MLIIEGSDCLGKTTFAKLLLNEADSRKQYPTFYSHMSRPNIIFDFFLDYQDMITKYGIQDRFHLGGIVYHASITQPKLEIIEGWLRSVGSMIIVLYASDFKWFEETIKKDKRTNLLNIETMIQANKDFIDLIFRTEPDNYPCPVIDFTFDIKSLISGHPEYPGRKEAKEIIDTWFNRLELL